jgi:hypothetical protein
VTLFEVIRKSRAGRAAGGLFAYMPHLVEQESKPNFKSTKDRAGRIYPMGGAGLQTVAPKLNVLKVPPSRVLRRSTSRATMPGLGDETKPLLTWSKPMPATHRN